MQFMVIFLGFGDLALSNIVCKDPQDLCKFRGYAIKKYGVIVHNNEDCSPCNVFVLPSLLILSFLVEILRIGIAIYRETKKTRAISLAPNIFPISSLNIQAAVVTEAESVNQFLDNEFPAGVEEDNSAPVDLEELNTAHVRVDEDSSAPISLEEDNTARSNVRVEDNNTSSVIMEEDNTAPVRKEEDNTAPVRKEENNTAPVRVEEDNTAPVRKEEDNTAPVRVEENNSAPVRKEEDNTAPVRVEENNTDPVRKEEDNTAPVRNEENNTAPVRKEEDNTAPVRVEENNTAPVRVEENNTDHARVEVDESAPVQLEENNTAHVRVEENNNAPVRMEDDNTASVCSQEENIASKCVEKDNTAPLGVEENDHAPVNAEEDLGELFHIRYLFRQQLDISQNCLPGSVPEQENIEPSTNINPSHYFSIEERNNPSHPGQANQLEITLPSTNLSGMSGLKQGNTSRSKLMLNNILKLILRPASFSIIVILTFTICVMNYHLQDHKTEKMADFLFIEVLSIIKRGIGLFLPVFLVVSEQKIIEYVIQTVKKQFE